ncbi:hypothetical protein HZS_782 [Henneguya salminicola]|nr:hypothetical protein HZS_782 [Henneguya salminicola]
MVLYEIIKKKKLKEKSIRILILGLDNAGKTSVIKCINGEDISDCSPTLGFKINTIIHDKYNVHYWDVGGQKNFRSYWRNYYEETDGIIWVVDSSDSNRLSLCKKELDSLLFEEHLQLDNMKSHHYQLFECSAATGLNVKPAIDWLISDISLRIFPIYD